MPTKSRSNDARVTIKSKTTENFLRTSDLSIFESKKGIFQIQTAAKYLWKKNPLIYKDREDARQSLKYCLDNKGGKVKSPFSDEFKRLTGRDKEQYKTDLITTDKKVANFHWKDVLPHLQGLQQVFKDGKDSQDFAKWEIKADKITIVVWGDLHLCSWASDYELFCQMTQELLSTPGLYVILVGDLLQMAINLRGVLEVADNAIPPKWQIRFLESWLIDIMHKVVCSTWDNHSVMREEKNSGFSQYANIFSRHVIYHDNIGHIDIKINDQVYKLAVSHFFRGRTMYNPVHGQMRYLRMTSNDREIAIAGDSHEPGLLKYCEGGHTRCGINSGSIQNSGYGKRFFSLLNSPIFPCIRLSGTEHCFTPFWSVRESLL